MFFHLLWSRQRRLSTSWRYDVDVKNVVFLRLSHSTDNWNKQTESWEWNFSFVAKLWRFDHMLFVVTSRCIRTDLGSNHFNTFVTITFCDWAHFYNFSGCITDFFSECLDFVKLLFFRIWWPNVRFGDLEILFEWWTSNFSKIEHFQIIFRTLILKITYIDNDNLVETVRLWNVVLADRWLRPDMTPPIDPRSWVCSSTTWRRSSVLVHMRINLKK